MMMWVALLGASMATYERSHLALEMGEKIWPQKWLRYVKAVAHGGDRRRSASFLRARSRSTWSRASADRGQR